ncbi:D-beta-hydroxybutyrate dehydrogenase, mitochondrial-like [Patiria miniata]|uniref:Uncharacterized protein n=1 Tax=Patiria miniata TaxID=46514 RepID=A0A914ARM4_PATMI|nr:D-beta-hydroxybutyrate dehydrogenase, mitochondrial-like [Patiria miniata]
MAAVRITNAVVFALCLYVCLVWIVPRIGEEFLSRFFGCILSVSFSYFIAGRFTGGKIPSVRGRAVLVTGCDTGIGNTLARRLDDLGFRVFAGCLFAEGPGALGLTSECSGRLEVIQLDVTSDHEVSQAVKSVRESLSTTGDVLWGVVNNAGTACWGEAEWISLDRYKKLAEVNLWGMIRVTKAFLPLIRNSKGRVVNMSSMLGRVSMPVCSAYSITKYGVQAFTDSLRNELASNFGVSAVIVEPGNFSGGGSAMFTREYMTKDLNKVWSETTAEVQEVYGVEYFESTRNNIVNASQSFSPTSLVPVVDACTNALTDANPHERYFPGNLTSKLTVYVFSFLPAPITDFVLGIYYKIISVPVKGAKKNGPR